MVIVAGDTAEVMRAVRELEGTSWRAVLLHALLPLEQSVATTDLEHAIYLAQLHCRLAAAQLAAAETVTKHAIARAAREGGSSGQHL